jgi:hypothetical protein
MTEHTIAIEDIGPIDRLEIPIPEGGGIVVLHGRNGNGKSHALQAVEGLTTGERQPVRDGQSRGVVEGLGARLTVARRTSRTGELTVEVLEGDDPTQLVDPGIKDPEAADRRRLEAMLRLAGAKPDTNLFASLVGGGENLYNVAAPSSLKAVDLPDMGARLKRDFEAAARKAESAADNHRGARDALSDAATVSEDLPDIESLRAKLHNTSVEFAREEERVKAAQTAGDAAAKAREGLRLTKEEYEGPTAEQARVAHEKQSQVVVELQEAYDAASDELRRLTTQWKIAEEFESTMAAWQETVDDAPSGVVDDTKLVDLGNQKDALNQHLEEAAVLIEKHRKHKEYREAGRMVADAEMRADGWREAAKGIEAVLTAQFAPIAPEGLQWAENRLVCDTKARGEVPFADLSPGERWSIALEIATRSTGSGSLLVIPQEAWESLDPINRQAAKEAAEKLDVVILTAEATDGPLRAEVEE